MTFWKVASRVVVNDESEIFPDQLICIENDACFEQRSLFVCLFVCLYGWGKLLFVTLGLDTSSCIRLRQEFEMRCSVSFLYLQITSLLALHAQPIKLMPLMLVSALSRSHCPMQPLLLTTLCLPGG